MLIGMREWMDECWVRWDAMVTVLFCEGGVRGETQCLVNVVPRL